jgi:hypothetical protein
MSSEELEQRDWVSVVGEEFVLVETGAELGPQDPRVVIGIGTRGADASFAVCLDSAELHCNTISVFGWASFQNVCMGQCILM